MSEEHAREIDLRVQAMKLQLQAERDLVSNPVNLQQNAGESQPEEEERLRQARASRKSSLARRLSLLEPHNKASALSGKPER